MRFESSFYTLPTIELAKALLGQKLCTRVNGVLTSGMIVEVEAYLGADDPACHASRGKTARNEVMFRSPGHCYVYLIYGMHYCINVVSDEVGVGSAVLIRAVEPLEGIEYMRRRRGTRTDQLLTSGPGRLCAALGITKTFSGDHYAKSKRVWLEPYRTVKADQIGVSTRIGISKAREHEWRFYFRDSAFVSKFPARKIKRLSSASLSSRSRRALRADR